MLFAEEPVTLYGAFITLTLLLAGLVGWLLRHVFTTIVPDILKEQGKQRELHEATVNKICESFKAEGEAERQQCKTQFERLIASIKCKGN